MRSSAGSRKAREGLLQKVGRPVTSPEGTFPSKKGRSGVGRTFLGREGAHLS